MEPGRKEAALEPHVLANVEPLPLDHRREQSAIQAAGADVPLRVLGGRRGRRVFAVAAMVVGMQIEDDDVSVES
jgi:hypothetical protein